MKTRRIIALIVGCALLLPGLGMLLGGAVSALRTRPAGTTTDTSPRTLIA